MYSELIERFFSSPAAQAAERKSSLYVFQGFTAEFYRELSASGIKHLVNADFSVYPEVPFDAAQINALSEGLASFKKIAWCCYEELLALAQLENPFSGRRFQITVVRNDLYTDGYPLPLSERCLKALNAAVSEEECADRGILEYYTGSVAVDGINYIRYIHKHFKLDIGTDCGEVGFYSSIDDGSENTAPENPQEIPASSLNGFVRNLEAGEISSGAFLTGSSTLSEEFSARVRRISILARQCGVSIAAGTEKALNVSDDKYLDILKRYWGEDAAFRTCSFYDDPAGSKEVREVSQGHIINDILAQCESSTFSGGSAYSDVIVTAPTGSGKSVFFQLPGIYLHENRRALTIVICPLIALMVDQVRELNERGIEFATFLNSAISYEERYERVQGIKSGKYSIVYLAPELLLAGDITDIIGDREIGLLTVDEAHLVTSWGRDFRVDYWFLGDYVEKLRKGTPTSPARRFPVLCLTATAVYGGSDDVVNDLIRSMHLTVYKNEMYIGFVRRDDIMFMVRRPDKNGRTDRQTKNSCAAKQIARSAEKHKKTIVYFPYKSQIDEIKTTILDEQYQAYPFVETYSGDMQSLDKDKSYNRFRDNTAPVMLATKAFGMGVNIDDISVVYHYAPTGSLSDYVQEIGRAARNHSKVPIGLAITDYMKSDMRYAQTLWGLSGLRHYQLKALLSRLYQMTLEKDTRELTVDPETFAYLFDDQSLDNKVKSGLMLLASDLRAHFGFNVLDVNAQSLFSTQFIIVPDSLKRRFMPMFSECIELMNDSFTQHELAYGKTAAVDTRKTGDIYRIDMEHLWEMRFSKMSFQQFKRQFFTGELFANIPGLGDSFDRVVPQMKLVIDYGASGFEAVTERFNALAAAVQTAFNALKSEFGGKNFTAKDFAAAFRANFECPERNEYINMLLELFTYPHVEVGASPKEQWKFIEKRKDSAGPGMAYCLRTQKSAYIAPNLIRFLQQVAPNTEDGQRFVAYIAIPRSGDKLSYQQLIAAILQMFGMATCEYTGGKNPHVSVRVNDPEKLRKLSDHEYSYRNTVLTDIEHRHERAKVIMNRFLGSEMKDSERWEVIESYFLGQDSRVDEMLGIGKTQKPVTSFDGFSFEGCDENTTAWSDGAEVLPYAAEMAEAKAAPAELIGGTLRIGEVDYPLFCVWLSKKVIFSESLIDGAASELLKNEGFSLFDMRNPNYELIK